MKLILSVILILIGLALGFWIMRIISPPKKDQTEQQQSPAHLDTTQWRIPKNDTVLYISDKYHVHKVVIIFSDSAY